MINITRKEDCCGCGACYDACSKNAILWETDREGFSYPRVDTSKCIDCGLCNKVCPIENCECINHHNDGFTSVVFAAYHKDEDIRFNSTSGGAFWGLAEAWVKDGGYVAGAIFTDHFKVKHIVTNDLVELQKIKGSKYCQSDCRGMYKQIRKLLISGEKVLATGLPCQMAGLRQFLRKDYNNLLAVDIICHSVPSPLLFNSYIEYLEKKYGAKMTQYHPKNKELGGWHKFSFKALFSNGKVYHQNKDLYTIIAFGSGHIMSRNSCFECHFKNIPQPSDISIGDFWGIELVDSSYDSPNGVSKVIVNNKKGYDYFIHLESLNYKEYDIKTAVFNNPKSKYQINRISPCNNGDRKRFVDNLCKYGFEYSVLAHTMSTSTIKQRLTKIIVLLRKRLSIFCRNSCYGK